MFQIILAGILAIWQAIEEFKNKAKKYRIISWITLKIALFITLFIFSISDFIQDRNNETKLSNIARFDINYGGLRIDTPKFRVSGATFVGGNGYLTFKSKFNDLLSIRAENGKYAFTIYIRDKNGEAIASLIGTTFKLYNPQYDFNYDDKGIEVVTGDQKVIFHLDFLPDGALMLGGILYTEDGLGWLIRPGEGGTFFEFITEKNYVLPDSLNRRIFDYPREELFGVRAKIF